MLNSLLTESYKINLFSNKIFVCKLFLLMCYATMQCEKNIIFSYSWLQLKFESKSLYLIFFFIFKTVKSFW